MSTSSIDSIFNNYKSIVSIVTADNKWRPLESIEGLWEYNSYLIDLYHSRVELSQDDFCYSFQLDEPNVITLVREFVENPDHWLVIFHNEQINSALANLD